jgi:hypothetical protein
MDNDKALVDERVMAVKKRQYTTVEMDMVDAVGAVKFQNG